jgi:hypothetical protein
MTVQRRRGRTAVLAVLGSAAVVTLVGIGVTPALAATASRSSAAANSGSVECRTEAIKRNVTLGMDKNKVRMWCYANTTDKTQWIRGVLDIPGLPDVHTQWVEIPANTWRPTPGYVESHEANSPFGDATLKTELYQCPPVVIGQCSPDNPYGKAIIAFADLIF